MNQPQRSKTNWAAVRWIGLVVALLGFQVALGVYAIALASSDPSVAVVPDYYAKSLDWDETQRLKRESDSLGWDIHVAKKVDDLSGSYLEVRLTDRDGAAIRLTKGTVQLYPHARATRAVEVNVEQVQSGNGERLAVSTGHLVGGWWQADFDVTDNAGNRFVASESFVVAGDN